MSKLAYSLNEEYFNIIELETIEKVIEKLVTGSEIDFEYEIGEKEKIIIYIGEPVAYAEDKGSDCYDHIIDYFQENAYEEGGEYAESYLETISKEAEEFLKDGLDKLFKDFLKMNKEEKNYFTIENVKTFEIYKDGSFKELQEEK